MFGGKDLTKSRTPWPIGQAGTTDCLNQHRMVRPLALTGPPALGTWLTPRTTRGPQWTRLWPPRFLPTFCWLCVPVCIPEEPAQELPQSLWKTTSARVSISPLRMNLISGRRQVPNLMNEWMSKLNEITTGHKWRTTFKSFKWFSCRDCCNLVVKAFPEDGFQKIFLSNGYTGCISWDEFWKQNTHFKYRISDESVSAPVPRL